MGTLGRLPKKGRLMMLSNRFQIGQLILIAVLAVLLVFSLGGERGVRSVNAAEPQAAPALAGVPGGPGYIMVPATAFVPGSPTAGYTIFWGELSVPSGSPGGLTYFYAPVYLPQGATLTGLTMFYRDTESDGNTLGVDLLRKPLPGATSGEGVGLSVYGDQIGFSVYQSDTTPDLTRAVIDNSQYAYWLSLYVFAAPAYLQLQAVRIDYGYNTNVPLVRR